MPARLVPRQIHCKPTHIGEFAGTAYSQPLGTSKKTKYNYMKIKLILLLILTNQIGQSQIILCEDSWAIKYEIIAKNGLKLRDGNNLKSKVIGVIPYKTEIKVCLENAKYDTIDKIEGNWVKAFWNNKEGYLFDGYIKRIEEKGLVTNAFNTRWDLVSEWKDFGFKKDKEYIGLYETDNPEEFELKIIPTVELVNKNYLTPLEEEVPIWVFRDLDIKSSGKIKGQVPEKMLYVGEQLWLEDRVIYGYGVVNKLDSLNKSNVHYGGFLSIDPYEIRTVNSNQEYPIDQLLLRMNCWGYDFLGANVLIMFVGDLDGDTKEDIIIKYRKSYKGWNYGLFSTKNAKEGENYSVETIGYGTE